MKFSSKSLVFPSSLRNLKIKIYKTIILTIGLYGCETWSLTLSKEHRLRMFQSRVLRRILGPKKKKVAGIMRSFITCTVRQILLG
jgi:hypothetical protein